MLAQTLAREAEVERTFRLNVIGETREVRLVTVME